jgi:hypothetical protein
MRDPRSQAVRPKARLTEWPLFSKAQDGARDHAEHNRSVPLGDPRPLQARSPTHPARRALPADARASRSRSGGRCRCACAAGRARPVTRPPAYLLGSPHRARGGGVSSGTSRVVHRRGALFAHGLRARLLDVEPRVGAAVLVHRASEEKHLQVRVYGAGAPSTLSSVAFAGPSRPSLEPSGRKHVTTGPTGSTQIGCAQPKQEHPSACAHAAST